ncbi:MAG: hypothetical protein KUG77_11645 [Nannocystaceae bacterium]|nr:hypothetical protein [Nannocystaceae bacterium]
MLEASIRDDVPVACDPSAIAKDEHARWLEVGRRLYGAVEEVVDLVDGYRMRLPPSQIALVGEHMSRDRLCCRFVLWTVVLTQDCGPLWLEITGPEGTKEVLRMGFETTDLLPESVASAAGFALSKRVPVEVDDILRMAEQTTS